MAQHYSKIKKLCSEQKLFELYEKHVEYLCSLIKTAKCNTTYFLHKIHLEFIPAATCHEIAVNDNSEIKVETHQNHLGEEKQYTEIGNRYKIGRDLRVKFLWERVAEELEKDIQLSQFDIIEEILAQTEDVEEYFCPYCGTCLVKYTYEIREINAYGETERILADTEWDTCEHVIFNNESKEGILGEILDDLAEELEKDINRYDKGRIIDDFASDNKAQYVHYTDENAYICSTMQHKEIKQKIAEILQDY